MSESARTRTTPRPRIVPAAESPSSSVNGVKPSDAGPRLPSPNAPYQKRTELLRLEDLRPHPQQATLFHDLEEAEFEELVRSMEREGLHAPIWATPDGMVV